jgi:predicted alpha/beta-fold hydrolase
LLVVLHGLEGSSRSSYVRGLVAAARTRGFATLALNFRGCSGELNRLPRFYHSGETGDLALVVDRLLGETPGRALFFAGFSLGANVLVKWLGERGSQLPEEVRAAVAISPPFDLTVCARSLDSPGFWNGLYRKRFLRSLKAKALEKARKMPDVFDERAIRAAHTFSEFDGALTAPLHGFLSADDYWMRSSSGRFLSGVRRPLLALVSKDDPVAPPDAHSLAEARGNPWVTLELTDGGGHVGFVSGFPLWPTYWAEARALDFLAGLASS